MAIGRQYIVFEGHAGVSQLMVGFISGYQLFSELPKPCCDNYTAFAFPADDDGYRALAQYLLASNMPRGYAEGIIGRSVLTRQDPEWWRGQLRAV